MSRMIKAITVFNAVAISGVYIWHQHRKHQLTRFQGVKEIDAQKPICMRALDQYHNMIKSLKKD